MGPTMYAGGGVGAVLTLTPKQIMDTPWTAVTACPGVGVKELWRRGDLVFALLRYESGASTPGTPHAGADQHLWVVEGEAMVADHRLSQGSYIYVPSGTPHPIRAVGPVGCVLLQSHMRVAEWEPTTATSCQQ